MPQPCCTHHISCPGAGNLDYDSPFANLSAEDPDPIKFLGLSWGWNGNYPWLGSNWTRNSCLGICESTISQDDADACARRNNLLCLDGDWGPPPPHNGGSSGPPLIYKTGTPRIPVTNDPQTCIASCPDGIGFAYTTPAGKYIAFGKILADRMAMSEACRFAVFAKICLGALTPSSVCTGKAYLATIAATGGTLPLSFTIVAGSLPAGVVLSQGPGDRDISFGGTPTVAGVYLFTIRCDDSSGHFMQKTFTLTVTGIDNTSLPDAPVGVAYSQTLTAATMTIPLTWSVSGGSLPDGLSLNSASGEISGTPTTTQTKTFTVQCNDGAGLSCTKQLSITVASSCPTLLTSVVVPDHTSTTNYFVVYGATGDLVHPNEYFVSQLDAVGIIDADTNTYVGTIALPAGLHHYGFGGAQVGGGVVHFPARDLGFSIFALSLDMVTHAMNQSLPFATNAFIYPSYDSTHAQIGYLINGSFPNNDQLIILNGTTLAQVSLFDISNGAINERASAMCYSASRDVYYVVGATNGIAPFYVRAIRRADGVKVFEQFLTNRPWAVAYLPTTDKIYIRTTGVSPLHYFVVVDATTGVIDSTTTLNPTAAIAGTGIEYWAAKDAFWLLGSAGGALQQNAILLSRQNLTEICTINAAVYRAGIYGSKSAVRRGVWPIGYQDVDIYQ